MQGSDSIYTIFHEFDAAMQAWTVLGVLSLPFWASDVEVQTNRSTREQLKSSLNRA